MKLTGIRARFFFAFVAAFGTMIVGCGDGQTIIDRISFASNPGGNLTYITKRSPWIAEYDIQTGKVRRMAPRLNDGEIITNILSLSDDMLALTVVSDQKSQILVFDIKKNRERRISGSRGDLLLKTLGGSKVWILRNPDYDPAKMLAASPYYGGTQGTLDVESGE